MSSTASIAKGKPASRLTRQRWQRSFVPRLTPLEDRCVPSLTPTVVNGVHLVYDSTAVDVTAKAKPGATGVYWLADANFAATKEGKALAAQYGVTGINPDGSMTYGTAIHWVKALNEAHFAGHDNWSLPGTLPTDPGILPNDPNIINNGKTGDTFGYDCAASPMGHLFYTEFGGRPGDTLSTLPNQTKLAYFNNFKPYYYWSGTASRSLPADFSFDSGFLGTDKDIDFEYVIPEFSSDKSNITGDLLMTYPIVDNIVVTPPPVPAPSEMLKVNPDGTIHDATLNINWLANANLAATNAFGISQLRLDPNQNPNLDKTSININPDGSMNHATAVEWINQLNTYDNGNGYLGHTNWRLPDSPDPGEQLYYKGITDSGTLSTELGELYYTELASQAGSTINRTHNELFSKFSNFQPYYYWSGSPINGGRSDTSDSKQSFSFGSGYRSDNTQYNFMYVIPVYDDPQTVLNTHDKGSGSLRQVIDHSHAGDTIVFSSQLIDPIITLNSAIHIGLDDESQPKSIDIEGPGAMHLTITGNGTDRLFDIGPYAKGFQLAGPPVTIAGAALESGQAEIGGAILDKSVPLVLRSDVFRDNQAIGPFEQDGLGGALAVYAQQTIDMSIDIQDCRFNDNHAIGSAGFGSGSGFAFSGAAGEGGAVYADAQNSFSFVLSVSASQFQNDSAQGGVGGDGFKGANGGAGGEGIGGAIYFTGSKAVDPRLNVSNSEFNSDSSIGGAGGLGAPRIGYVSAGSGGHGGDSLGGAIYFQFASIFDSSARFHGDECQSNSAIGGRGGDGGFSGGQGALGGTADGGALKLVVPARADRTLLDMTNSNIDQNVAQGGAGGSGGNGGSGALVGFGGAGGSAIGGGLSMTSTGSQHSRAWTLNSVDLIGNHAKSGNGGRGGSAGAAPIGGRGGNSHDSKGGAIFDGFDGKLVLLGCNVSTNLADHGLGGAGGSGIRQGRDGNIGQGIGGGLYIDMVATVLADSATSITNNYADKDNNHFGDVGSI
jgi:hypothetical protein